MRDVKDERDLSWLGRSPAPPPPPTERTIWRATKGARTAEARVRLMAHGHELRFVVRESDGSEDVMWSRLFHEGESEAIRVHSAGVLQDFQRLGWTLVADSAGPPQ